MNRCIDEQSNRQTSRPMDEWTHEQTGKQKLNGWTDNGKVYRQEQKNRQTDRQIYNCMDGRLVGQTVRQTKKFGMERVIICR